MKAVIITAKRFDCLIEPWLDEDISNYLTSKGYKPEMEIHRSENDPTSLHLSEVKRTNKLLVEAVETLYPNDSHRYLEVIELPDENPDNFVVLEKIVDGMVTNECIIRKDALFKPKPQSYNSFAPLEVV